VGRLRRTVRGLVILFGIYYAFFLVPPAQAQQKTDLVSELASGPTLLEKIRALRTPDEQFKNLPDYPFKPNYVEVQRNLRIHYIDEGPRDAAPLLLLHGQPTWSYLYRKMVLVLAKAGHRVIAPDLIGFGKSDKPSSVKDYTYDRHVTWIAALIKELDLRDITLVVHDWGGLIGHRVLVESQQPERFWRLVVLNTSLPVGDYYERATPGFIKAGERWRNRLLTEKNLKFAPVIKVLTATQLSLEVLAAYDAPFPDDSYKSGPRVLTSLIPRRPDDPGVQENIRVKEALSRFHKPVLIAFTDDDSSHPGQHKLFSNLFPRDVVWRDVSVMGAKHLLQEDKGEEVAALINEFIKSTSGK
jgi:haloalkane dehalogenase